jgi:hypothetical protein
MKMKTIGYSDRCDGSGKIYIYTQGGTRYNLFNQKKNERIQAAFSDLKHLGNVFLYYVNGNKARLISVRNI